MGAPVMGARCAVLMSVFCLMIEGLFALTVTPMPGPDGWSSLAPAQYQVLPETSIRIDACQLLIITRKNGYLMPFL